MLQLREMVGRALGTLWGPAARAGSVLRQARILHPEGINLRAEVTPIQTDPPFLALAERLEGPALVRLSSAVWRGGREWPDILGAAVRFRGTAPLTEEAAPGDQDVLFATLRTPWTLGLAPLTTDVHDWLQNDYYAVSPFAVRGLGRAKLRLTSCGWRDGVQGSRVERLAAALGAGTAIFTFEVFPLDSELPHTWTPVADIVLREEVTLDPAFLRFDPFRDGRGISPRGFIHALRLPTYRQSQEGRVRH
jgi:hypothetical protein